MPMSSPQMTRMFGFFCCVPCGAAFCATLASFCKVERWLPSRLNGLVIASASGR